MLRQADGSLAISDWDTALGKVADGLRTILDRDGPDAIAFYLSGQLLTEDYYVANKLMKGFLGSANVDTNSRLCMASSVAGHRRAFGADTVPGIYRDFDEADLIVLVGSNAAWCHPVLHQRMIAAKNERGATHRRHRSAAHRHRRSGRSVPADRTRQRHRAVLRSAGVSRRHALHSITRYIARHTAALTRRSRDAATSQATPPRLRDATGLDPADIVRFFELFRQTERVVTCFSQGVNQSAQGTDKVNAIINVHLATGRIGRPGMGPFSLTGQPNAMGGREVGGLANQLAAHMGFSRRRDRRVRRFWNAPRMAPRQGLKAVDMFEAIERRRIKALWVMATNPAVSLPRAGAMRAALDKLDLFVVSETMLRNDTVEAGAHVLLPAAAWGEKDGTVTNSERRMSRQRAFLPLPGEAQPDWWIVSEVARPPRLRRRLSTTAGRPIFFASTRHCRHSKMTGSATSTLGGLAGLADADYDLLDPVMWPLPESAERGEKRFFADGGFFTSDRRGRFIAPAISAAAGGDQRGFSASPQYRTPARSMAHHDAHRTEPAAGRALPRTASGYSSR